MVLTCFMDLCCEGLSFLFKHVEIEVMQGNLHDIALLVSRGPDEKVNQSIIVDKEEQLTADRYYKRLFLKKTSLFNCSRSI